MKILLYGSAHLSAIAEKALMAAGHDIVGHVPCANPSFPGQMQSPVGPAPHDIKLSVLYDRLITDIDRGWNLHPGLLPRWGGCDILYHTVAERGNQQGLTFHQLTDAFDDGPILMKTVYPVCTTDSIPDLYRRVMCVIGPTAVAGVSLIEAGVEPRPQRGPRTYYPRHTNINEDAYRLAGEAIRRLIASELQP